MEKGLEIFFLMWKRDNSLFSLSFPRKRDPFFRGKRVSFPHGKSFSTEKNQLIPMEKETEKEKILFPPLGKSGENILQPYSYCKTSGGSMELHDFTIKTEVVFTQFTSLEYISLSG